MAKKASFTLFVLLTYLLVSSCAGAFAESRVHVHFFVVPAVAKDGKNLSEELAKLRQELISLAGGYTELGPSRGGSMGPNGVVTAEDNYSFVVAAPKNITAELEKYIPEHFATEHPFVLVWEANSSLPAGS